VPRLNQLFRLFVWSLRVAVIDAVFVIAFISCLWMVFVVLRLIFRRKGGETSEWR
jgi:hypothetical protein